MRFLILAILTVFFFAAVDIRVNGGASSQVAFQADRKIALELAHEIVTLNYCIGGGVLLSLESKFKNTGEEPLIVFKYALSPSEYMISQSQKAAMARSYEKVVFPMIGSVRSLIEFGDVPPSDYFITLAPGHSFTAVNQIAVVVSVADSDQDGSVEYLGPGDHVLEVDVATWPFDKSLGNELQMRWKRFGTLWKDSVKSLPIKFHIKRSADRTLTDCNLTLQ